MPSPALQSHLKRIWHQVLGCTTYGIDAQADYATQEHVASHSHSGCACCLVYVTFVVTGSYRSLLTTTSNSDRLGSLKVQGVEVQPTPLLILTCAP